MEYGDNSATNDTKASGSKRSFGDLEDVENDNSGSKKVCTKMEESDPGVAAAMILSLQESLQKCKEDLASSQNELESVKTELESDKSEVNKWKSAFEKESFVPARTSPEPGFVIDYIEKLRSSETTLKEQLEIAHMKLAIHDLKAQLKPPSMQRFTTNGDPEVENKQGLTAAAGPSHEVSHLKEVEVDKNHHPNDGGTSSPLLEELDVFEASKKFITLIAKLKEVQDARLMEMAKAQSECAARLVEMGEALAERAESIEQYGRIEKFLLEKFPSLVPPSASEGGDA